MMEWWWRRRVDSVFVGKHYRIRYCAVNDIDLGEENMLWCPGFVWGTYTPEVIMASVSVRQSISRAQSSGHRPLECALSYVQRYSAEFQPNPILYLVVASCFAGKCLKCLKAIVHCKRANQRHRSWFARLTLSKSMPQGSNIFNATSKHSEIGASTIISWGASRPASRLQIVLKLAHGPHCLPLLQSRLREHTNCLRWRVERLATSFCSHLPLLLCCSPFDDTLMVSHHRQTNSGILRGRSTTRASWRRSLFPIL
jgi:hypothetical protein